MAEPEKDQPSLELPKLGLRRRKRPAPPPDTVPAAAPPADLVEPVEPAADPPRDAVTEPVTEPVTQPVTVEETAPLVAEQTRPVAVEVEEPPPARVREPKRPREPRVRKERGPGGMGAAVLTGLVVGLGICGLTWASLRACEGIQGTSSCGDIGYPMLGLILAVMVVVGWLLLRFLRVPEPGSTSFLGTGLAVVIALLVLVDHLLDRSMVAVVPLVCAVTFALAHWVTTTFIEPPRD